MSNDLSFPSVQELLIDNTQKAIYLIPFYQRNYAWEETEITHLIQDVIDSMPNDGTSEARNYYIGTLVVYQRPNTSPPIFETIDGQQRLTTLSLLVAYLYNKRKKSIHPCIQFENREKSRATLEAIFDGKLNDKLAQGLDQEGFNQGILKGYRLIEKVLGENQKNGLAIEKFENFLLNYVKILRVKVPDDTNRNHYFEIMNSRGEQLEKHEVLKARLLEMLETQDRDCLHTVWEACANMERYVQIGFTPAQRAAIFNTGDEVGLKVSDFDNLRDQCKIENGVNTGSNATTKPTSTFLDCINIAPPRTKSDPSSEEKPERFNKIVDFPNFLLHVLSVSVNSPKDISLDDKQLLKTFDIYFNVNAENSQKVKKFVLDLLRCKYLLDTYIIKREFIAGESNWSLQRLKLEKDGAVMGYVNTFGTEADGQATNRQILMLLSAFHVSAPTNNYKHWLNAALHFLSKDKPIDAQSYCAHMESVAKAFVFDNNTQNHSGKVTYSDIIHANGSICKTNQNLETHERLKSNLVFGNINNFVFNFLDYLLWLNLRKSDSKIESFRFGSHNSVEHYYPQNPFNDSDKLDEEMLHSLGNLCLISHQKNSMLGNQMPEDKKKRYEENGKLVVIDSIKQYLMMKQTTPWDAASIEAHGKEMVQVLIDCFEKPSPAPSPTNSDPSPTSNAVP